MTKTQLIDKLRSAVEPILTDFVAQPSPGASANEEQRKAIEQRRENARKSMGDDDPGFQAASKVYDDELDGLKVSTSQQKKENQRLAAEALVAVTNELRIPVKLKKKSESGAAAPKGRAGTERDGRKNRKSPETLEKEVAAVLKALPRATAGFVPKSEITKKVGFDPTSALLKLKRLGDAASNGRRGTGGGWRKG